MKPAYPSTPAALTPRQRQVVTRLSEGATVEGIALELGLSSSTVEFHSLKARRRLRLTSMAGLVRYAILHGLSPLELPLPGAAPAAVLRPPPSDL